MDRMNAADANAMPNCCPIAVKSYSYEFKLCDIKREASNVKAGLHTGTHIEAWAKAGALDATPGCVPRAREGRGSSGMRTLRVNEGQLVNDSSSERNSELQKVVNNHAA
eukprot:1805429-Pleurochrysis_carterae.AAC.5